MVYRMGFECPWDKYPNLDFVQFDLKDVRLAPDVAEGNLAIKRSIVAF